uniref:ANK_REP_REGION domain-containing protein n=1 Tax=Macrostomum lignano TaxID=282301 RepID=A0A1I8IIV4_9PLAT
EPEMSSRILSDREMMSCPMLVQPFTASKSSMECTSRPSQYRVQLALSTHFTQAVGVADAHPVLVRNVAGGAAVHATAVQQEVPASDAVGVAWAAAATEAVRVAAGRRVAAQQAAAITAGGAAETLAGIPTPAVLGDRALRTARGNFEHCPARADIAAEHPVGHIIEANLPDEVGPHDGRPVHGFVVAQLRCVLHSHSAAADVPQRGQRHVLQVGQVEYHQRIVLVRAEAADDSQAGEQPAQAGDVLQPVQHNEAGDLNHIWEDHHLLAISEDCVSIIPSLQLRSIKPIRSLWITWSPAVEFLIGWADTSSLEESIHEVGNDIKVLEETKALLNILFDDVAVAREHLNKAIERAAGFIEDCKKAVSRGSRENSTNIAITTIGVGLSLLTGRANGPIAFAGTCVLSGGWMYKTYRSKQHIDELDSLIREAERKAYKTVELQHQLSSMISQLNECIRAETRRREQQQQQWHSERWIRQKRVLLMADKSEAWSEALIFLAAFVIINAVIMLVFWFSYAITSSNRMSSIDFADFSSAGQRKVGDQPDQQNRLLIQEEKKLEARDSGRFSNPRQSSGSSDRSSLSELGFDSSSDEKLIASMSGQALSSTTDTRFFHRTISLQKQLRPESIGMLQQFEENATDDFKQLLAGLSDRRDGKIKDPGSSKLAQEDAPTPNQVIEYRRYHKLVPIRRFEPGFLLSPDKSPSVPRQTSLGGTKARAAETGKSAAAAACHTASGRLCGQLCSQVWYIEMRLPKQVRSTAHLRAVYARPSTETGSTTSGPTRPWTTLPSPRISTAHPVPPGHQTSIRLPPGDHAADRPGRPLPNSALANAGFSRISGMSDAHLPAAKTALRLSQPEAAIGSRSPCIGNHWESLATGSSGSSRPGSPKLRGHRQLLVFTRQGIVKTSGPAQCGAQAVPAATHDLRQPAGEINCWLSSASHTERRSAKAFSGTRCTRSASDTDTDRRCELGSCSRLQTSRGSSKKPRRRTRICEAFTASAESSEARALRAARTVLLALLTGALRKLTRAGLSQAHTLLLKPSTRLQNRRLRSVSSPAGQPGQSKSEDGDQPASLSRLIYLRQNLLANCFTSFSPASPSSAASLMAVSTSVNCPTLGESFSIRRPTERMTCPTGSQFVQQAASLGSHRRTTGVQTADLVAPLQLMLINMMKIKVEEFGLTAVAMARIRPETTVFITAAACSRSTNQHPIDVQRCEAAASPQSQSNARPRRLSLLHRRLRLINSLANAVSVISPRLSERPEEHGKPADHEMDIPPLPLQPPLSISAGPDPPHSSRRSGTRSLDWPPCLSTARSHRLLFPSHSMARHPCDSDSVGWDFIPLHPRNLREQRGTAALEKLKSEGRGRPGQQLRSSETEPENRALKLALLVSANLDRLATPKQEPLRQQNRGSQSQAGLSIEMSYRVLHPSPAESQAFVCRGRIEFHC